MRLAPRNAFLMLASVAGLSFASAAHADAFGGAAAKDLEVRIQKMEQEIARLRRPGGGEGATPGGGGRTPEMGPSPRSAEEREKEKASTKAEVPLTEAELGYSVRGTINGLTVVDYRGSTSYLSEEEFKDLVKEATAAAKLRRANGPGMGEPSGTRALNLPPPPTAAGPGAMPGAPVGLPAAMPAGGAMGAKPQGQPGAAANKPGAPLPPTALGGTPAAPAASAAPAPVSGNAAALNKPPAAPPVASKPAANPPASSWNPAAASVGGATNSNPSGASMPPASPGNTAAARQAARSAKN